MKALYSQLKQLVPGLKAQPQELGDKFTLAGFMLDGLKKVVYRGKPDYLMSFEVRQNRADCFGVWGLAREAAAYYGLSCQLPLAKVVFPSGQSGIRVSARSQVKRALAVELKGAKNKPSPLWLKEFLAFYGINSVNRLVDLSNYAMVLTGYPSHLLDKSKMQGELCWATNKDFKKITTLDGTRFALRGKEIILTDDRNILGLAGIVGGRQAAIDMKTTDLIVEMAVYDRLLVRQDSRDLKITTEASTRLEKELDTNGLEPAFEFLVSLLIKEAGGSLVSFFSYFPKPRLSPKISFDPSLASVLSGIDISSSQARQTLKSLRFKVGVGAGKWQVEPPKDRTDVSLAEDVAEEIIRLVGYERIPARERPVFKAAEIITPAIVVLSEKIRDILTTLGFDEILSWPLTRRESNLEVNYRQWKSIRTQNSVNEEFPELRQSLASGLLGQRRENRKKNVEKIKLFEIGKVFGQKENRYWENDSLGLLAQGKAEELRKVLENLLRSLGLDDVSYSVSQSRPALANSRSVWDILAKGKPMGILYKLAREKDLALAEIDLNVLVKLLKETSLSVVVELDQKLIVLDANIELAKDEDIRKTAEFLRAKIGEKNLWSLRIVDVFPLGNKIRYTLQVSYLGLSDQEAKTKHLKVFELTQR